MLTRSGKGSKAGAVAVVVPAAPDPEPAAQYGPADQGRHWCLRCLRGLRDGVDGSRVGVPGRRRCIRCACVKQLCREVPMRAAAAADAVVNTRRRLRGGPAGGGHMGEGPAGDARRLGLLRIAVRDLNRVVCGPRRRRGHAAAPAPRRLRVRRRRVRAVASAPPSRLWAAWSRLRRFLL